MEELVKKLNMYTKAYDEGNPIISDEIWDKFYFELMEKEKEAGYALPNSPTQTINYQVVDTLRDVELDHLMLSLDKTKSIEEVADFIAGRSFLCMSKLDGLSCTLRYENGKLISAATRGSDGKIGKDIFHNACVIKSIPKQISYKKTLIVDGEIICKLNDFEKVKDDYANARNYASGSIHLHDSSECEKRNLTFVAWDVIEGFNEEKTVHIRLAQLYSLGFTVVPIYPSSAGLSVEEMIDKIKTISENSFYPIDGVVFKLNDVEYRDTLGHTGHHFNNGIAFKFYNESIDSKLIDITYDVSRNGYLTPVAVFEPVEIYNTSVTRASMHNVSVVKDITDGEIHVGDTIYVTKSNEIIPMITGWKHNLNGPTIEFPPKTCPFCGEMIFVEKSESGTEELMCTNKNCSRRLNNRLNHFVSKEGLDIMGISNAVLNDLIEWGWVKSERDLFTLEEHKLEWYHKQRYGKVSVDKILGAIETAKTCSLSKYISAFGIPLIGKTNAQALEKVFKTWTEFRNSMASGYKFYMIQDFGIKTHDSLLEFDYSEADFIAENYIRFYVPTEVVNSNNQVLAGKTIVITGSLNTVSNRKEMEDKIVAAGGKCAGSVSKNTFVLINNDINSTSSKNKTARKLNIPILTEQEFIEAYLTN